MNDTAEDVVRGIRKAKEEGIEWATVTMEHLELLANKIDALEYKLSTMARDNALMQSRLNSTINRAPKLDLYI